jgi:hypothetical protein
LCSVFRAVEPYNFNMSIGELCALPPAPSEDAHANTADATPASPSGPDLARGFAGLFSPEPAKATQPTDWSDIAAVAVVSQAFDDADGGAAAETRPRADSRPRASSRARPAQASAAVHNVGDTTTAAATDSTAEATLHGETATTPPKKGGGTTPKKERRTKGAAKKGKKMQRVRSIIDPDDVDDERGGSVTSGELLSSMLKSC